MANLLNVGLLALVFVSLCSIVSGAITGYYSLWYNCAAACDAPGYFCAQETYSPWRFYCTNGVSEDCDIGRRRDYYFQVECVDWDYLPDGVNNVNDNNDYLLDSLVNRADRVGSRYFKYLYKRYTDGFYNEEILPTDSWGYVGPIIHAEVNDLIWVHIRNIGSHNISIHPHGVRYNKANEGAFYLDGTSGNDKVDDSIPPNATVSVRWFISELFAPTDDDPNCVPYSYHGHLNPAAEINAGLIGLIIVCKPGILGGENFRQDVDREHILYVDSIDEAGSLLIDDNLNRCGSPASCSTLFANEEEVFMESLKKDNINGFMYANGAPLEVCVGERVAWYVFSLEAELHAIEIHGHTFEFEHKRTAVTGIWSATFATAMTVSTEPGMWLISCRNTEHNRNGMNAYLSVQTCGAAPVTEQLNGENRIYYIAAEEATWDYAPLGYNVYDGGSLTAAGTASAELFTMDANHIGGQYKKARFVEYSDASFTTQLQRTPEEEHLALLGPVIRAEVEDTITVVLKNSLSINVSMYLQGVKFDKSEDGLWEKAGGSQLSGKIATPGSVVMYYYTVPWSVAPDENDPTCISYLYYSAIDPERDASTGLVGPLLICKYGGIDPLTGIQRYIDREMFILFGDNDENLSWFIDDNIANSGVTTTAPDFEASNIMRGINGRCYGNLEGLTLCKGDRVAWHVNSVGANEGLHGAVFNGNNLLISGVNRDSHVTIPEVGFTAKMIPDNVGNWSLHCGNNDHFEHGEKALYDVGACGDNSDSGYDISGVTREYFIAAVEMDWDYSPNTINPISGENYSDPSSSQYNRVRKDGVLLGSIYKKALYLRYTDNTFTTVIPKDERLGILGNPIHCAVGDIVKVVFKNMASRPYSIHPQGLKYTKEYEGHAYHMVTPGDAVPAGQTFTYYWEVAESSGPTETGPNCIGSMYHSAVDPVKDAYSGLIGPLVICKPGILDAANVRHDSVTEEFPILMLAFDENQSWYLQDNINTNAPGTDATTDEFIESNKYDSLNGLIYGNLQGLVMNAGETVAWYVLGLGLSEDIHTLHMHGQMSIYKTNHDHILDVIEVFPWTCETCTMFCENIGTWLMHCHVGEHTIDGMVTTFTINP